jgi:hypothetical protein
MTPVRATLLALAAIGSFSLPHCDHDHRHRKPQAPVAPNQPPPPPSDNDDDDDDDSTDWGPFGHHGNKPGNSPDHRQDGDHRNENSLR